MRHLRPEDEQHLIDTLRGTLRCREDVCPLFVKAATQEEADRVAFITLDHKLWPLEVCITPAAATLRVYELGLDGSIRHLIEEHPLGSSNDLNLERMSAHLTAFLQAVAPTPYTKPLDILSRNSHFTPAQATSPVIFLHRPT